MLTREQAQVLARSIWALELALDEFDTGPRWTGSGQKNS